MALKKQEFDDNEEQSSKTTKRSRITIDVSPELRRRIKMAALKRDLSISEFIGKILEQSIPDDTNVIEQEEHPVTPDFLEQVYRVRERIMRESNGKLFEDSAELLRQQREERTQYLEQLREQP